MTDFLFVTNQRYSHDKYLHERRNVEWSRPWTSDALTKDLHQLGTKK